MLPSSRAASSSPKTGAADAPNKEGHCVTSVHSRVAYGSSTSHHKEKHQRKATTVKRSKASKAETGWKWKGSQSGRQLEEEVIHQEKAYREEQFTDEERMTFKDWRRRLRAAELRGNARRWKAKRVQDEQKAMEAASSFAQPIRPKPAPPLKLISL